jgi:membrane protease YdiL (CAAX protease family)
MFDHKLWFLKKDKEISGKSIFRFIFISLFLYLIWTFRSYIAYTFLGLESMSQQMSIHQSLYLNITKFSWLLLALFLSTKYLKDTKENYFKNYFNKGFLTWGLFGLIPILYLFYFLDIQNILRESNLSISFLTEYKYYSPIFSVVFEETLFRGFMLPFLVKYLKPFWAIVLQSLLFTFSHYCWWIFDPEQSIGAGSLYIFIVGLIWGFIAYKTKSIYPSIISHYIHNLLFSI